MVQQVFLVAASFQVSHAGLPNWGSDGGRKVPHWCGDEVFLVDPAQVVKRPRISGEENPSPCTFAIVPGSVAIAYRSHHSR
jgi:hypothetical protein